MSNVILMFYFGLMFQPCTETLYLTLMKEFRSSLSPVILKLMEEYQGIVDASNMNAILIKDAGICYELNVCVVDEDNICRITILKRKKYNKLV